MEASLDDLKTAESEILKEKELRMADQIKKNPVAAAGYSSADYDCDWKVWEEIGRLLYAGHINEAENFLEESVASRGGEKSMRMLAALGEIYLWRFNFVHVSKENEDLCMGVVESLELAARAALGQYGDAPKGLFQSLFGHGSQGTMAGDGDAAATTTAGAAASSISSTEKRRLVLEAQVCLAYCPLCYSIFYMRGGSKTGLVKGAYYLRKSYAQFVEAEKAMKKLVPGAECSAVDGVPSDLVPIACLIKFGLGVFHFAVSLIPPSLKWFINLIGFSGNRERAVQELTFAADKRGPKKTEAKLVLMAMRQFYGDDEAGADEIMNELQQQFPNSPMLLTAEAGMQRVRGHPRNALTLYERSAEIAHRGLPQMLCQQKYHAGSCAFILNNWQPAARDLLYFLEHTTGNQFKPYAGFMLLFSKWMLGERGEPLLQLARDAISWVRPNQSFDTYAKRRCSKFVDTGAFTELEEILLAATALHEAKEWKPMLKLLDTAPPLLQQQKDDRNYFALFYWLKGSALKGLGKKPERATAFLKQAVEQAPFCDVELHGCVYALVDLAEMEIDAGRIDGAQEYWTHAKTFSGYDWEKLVSNRISITQEKAKRNRSKK